MAVDKVIITYLSPTTKELVSSEPMDLELARQFWVKLSFPLRETATIVPVTNGH